MGRDQDLGRARRGGGVLPARLELHSRAGLGAAIFGIPPPEGVALGYVSALGFRDVALGLYIAALAMWSTRGAVGMVLAISALIPVGDVSLVTLLMGSSSLASLVLHVAGGVALALVGFVTMRG